MKGQKSERVLGVGVFLVFLTTLFPILLPLVGGVVKRLFECALYAGHALGQCTVFGTPVGGSIFDPAIGPWYMLSYSFPVGIPLILVLLGVRAYVRKQNDQTPNPTPST